MENENKQPLSITVNEDKGEVKIARGYSSVTELTSHEISLLTIINEKILKGESK